MAGKNELLPLPEPQAYTLEPQNVPDDVRPMNTIVVGNTGSGKSATSRSSFVEPLLLNKRRVCIIDPTGVWWGLRFKADGSPGFRIAIVGGLYGDAPLGENDGERLAQHVGESDTPIIVDVSEFSIGERHTFATDFFQALYKHNRRPLHLVTDEADEFAPQNPLPETRRMLHHFDRIVRRGRVRGFRNVMVTQRPAVLHKNVLSQANVLIAMRLLGSQDRDAVLLWIKGQGNVEAGKQVLNTLAKLQTGEGWLWAPSLDILNRGRFPMFTTFDSSRTPKDDEPPVEPPGKFPYEFPELEWLGSDDPPEPIAVAAMDPEQLDKYRAIAFEKGRQKGFDDGYAAGTSTVVGKITGIINAGNEFIEQLRDLRWKESGAEDAGKNGGVVHPKPAPMPGQHSAEVVVPKVSRSITNVIDIPKRKPAPAQRIASTLPPAAEKLLQALARYADQLLTWDEVCIVAVMAPGNGHFYGGAKHLRQNGFIVEEGQSAQISPVGLKLTGGKKAPYSLQELLDLWSPVLRPPGGEMLAVLCRKPYAMTQADLASRIGRTTGNGHWYGGIKALTKHHLAIAGSGSIELTAFMKAAAKVK